jgi:hypothetical protein
VADDTRDVSFVGVGAVDCLEPVAALTVVAADSVVEVGSKVSAGDREEVNELFEEFFSDSFHQNPCVSNADEQWPMNVKWIPLSGELAS